MTRVITLLLILFVALTASAQPTGHNVFSTKTNPKGGPYAIMTMDTLQGAQTVKDIYARFPAKWVKTYDRVEISVYNEDHRVSSVAKSDTLTKDQLKMLSDFGEEGTVKISMDYIPKNNLAENPPRKEEFWLTWVPIFEAKYPGGELRLEDRLRDIMIEHLDPHSWTLTGLISFKFTVDQSGNIIQPQMACSSMDTELDQEIMRSLQNLDQFTPARDYQGNAITQEFEFRMGTDLMRCDYKY